MEYFWILMAAVGVVTTTFILFTVTLLWASKKLSTRMTERKKTEEESYGQAARTESFWKINE